MPNEISEITNKIRNKLPYWLKEIKNNNESVGAQFLNVFGLEIEDIIYLLQYAWEQINLTKIDVTQIYMIYKCFIPFVIDSNVSISIYTDNHTLVEVPTLRSFFSNINTTLPNSEIQFPNPFIVDYQKSLIYVKLPYDQNEEFKFGKVHVIIEKNNEIILDNDLKLLEHQVWNFFDEFGLLLATPRLNNEDNEKYKNRLLDVFKNRSNSSIDGMINGITRELGLRKYSTWEDSTIDFEINDPMVIINSIQVDDNKWEDVYIDKITNKVVLKGNPNEISIIRNVSWAYGFSIHTLNNKNDTILQREIDYNDQPMILYILDQMNKKSPILWDNISWDVSKWDITNNIIGFVPIIYDSKFLGE